MSATSSVRVPYLDFAPDFVASIQDNSKRATARCPGPKDTDVTSDLDAILAQGWALATCSSENRGKGFAVLKIDKVETRRVDEIDDELARIEGMNSGDELRAALSRFYPGISSEDSITILYFQVLHNIPTAVL
eukprot:TRINITY_DN42950_c0_g1_i1.p1 TRINITY_DN42950_c0_g1~~TRINITY_DN42950_c0_g1_i1.p1  ORF type:complete len:146 (-),score=24.01 TRINITY_DN42950_c0_g1_i1:61-459(-)